MAVPNSSSSQAGSLFDRYRVGSYFSSQVTVKPEFLIHFFLAQGKPLENIIKFMDLKGSELCKQWINSKYSEHGLTALHIAVFKENKAAVEHLLLRGANPTIKDAYGFTPWKHTALLVDYKAIENLVRTEQENAKEWKLLRTRAGLEPHAPSLQQLSIQDSKGLRKASEATLKEDLGLDHYIDDIGFKFSEHYLLWQLPLIQAPSSPQEAFLQRKNQNLPELCIQRSRFLSQNGVEIRGLHAVSQLKRGDLIGPYGGRIRKMGEFSFARHFSAHKPSDDYWMVLMKEWGIDAYNEGNALRFSNDGWPNAGLIPSPESHQHFHVIEQVAPGEEILWDYGVGMDGLKWGKYILTKTDEMEAYFRKQSPVEIITKLKQLESKGEQGKTPADELVHTFNRLNLESRLSYLFTTPLATIYLCLKRVFKAEDLLIMLRRQKSLMAMWKIERDIGFFHTRMLVSTLWVLAELQKEYQKAPARKKEVMTALFEAFISRFVNQTEVYRIIFGLYIMDDNVKQDKFVQMFSIPGLSLEASVKYGMEHIFPQLQKQEWSEEASFHWCTQEIIDFFKEKQA